MGGQAEVILTDEQSLRFERSLSLIDIFKRSVKELKKIGAVTAVGALHNELHKEERRMRGVAKEDPAVLGALAQRRDRHDEEDIKRRRLVSRTNLLEAKQQQVTDEIEEAKAELARRKAQLKIIQEISEAAVAAKRFSPEMLGLGHAKGGTVAMRKNRFQLMDRIASVGAGLSAEQKNDWTWFKESWDKKMSEEHKDQWGTVFAGWMQGVLENMREENNAMSLFVYSETVRCFAGDVGVVA